MSADGRAGADGGVLDEEEPAPAGLAQDAAHVQHTVGDKAGDDAADVGGHPEVSKADGELGLCVEVCIKI